jgi:hypothetical protein
MSNTNSKGSGEENNMNTNKSVTEKAFERFCKKYMVADEVIVFASKTENAVLFATAYADSSVRFNKKERA